MRSYTRLMDLRMGRLKIWMSWEPSSLWGLFVSHVGFFLAAGRVQLDVVWVSSPGGKSQ